MTLTVDDFQKRIEAIYHTRDAGRGVHGTYAWLVEEVGELARALRRGDPANLREDLGDCFAGLASLASLAGVTLSDAAQKYGGGGPRCAATPCACAGHGAAPTPKGPLF
jgi:NTP pyrophosphatase (non-canonical NTP hydrolase)